MEEDGIIIMKKMYLEWAHYGINVAAIWAIFYYGMQKIGTTQKSLAILFIGSVIAFKFLDEYLHKKWRL